MQETITPDTHLSMRKFPERKYTRCPDWNSRKEELNNICCFCEILILTSCGLTRSRRVRKLRPKNSLDGDSPVVVLGAFRYCRKSLFKFVCSEFLVVDIVFSASFTVWTYRSAWPFVAGWYG